MPALARFFGEVVRRAGGARAVADRLDELGFQGADGPYNEQSVRAWVRGSRTPNAGVLLALTLHFEVPLDIPSLPDNLRAAVEDLDRRLTLLEERTA